MDIAPLDYHCGRDGLSAGAERGARRARAHGHSKPTARVTVNCDSEQRLDWILEFGDWEKSQWGSDREANAHRVKNRRWDATSAFTIVARPETATPSPTAAIGADW